jgi:hypothetical protein
MNATEKSLGTLIGESLRPVALKEAAMANKTTILDALRESRREIREEIDEERARLTELEAREQDMTAEIAAIQGAPLDAAYCRARAAQMRNPTPETAAARHLAYVRLQADYHVRLGTVPADNDPDREAIEAAMDEMRVRQ